MRRHPTNLTPSYLAKRSPSGCKSRYKSPPPIINVTPQDVKRKFPILAPLLSDPKNTLIIAYCLMGVSYNYSSRFTKLTPNACKCRAKRIFKRMGVKNREELINILRLLYGKK
jgi:hypothetical protein